MDSGFSICLSTASFFAGEVVRSLPSQGLISFLRQATTNPKYVLLVASTTRSSLDWLAAVFAQSGISLSEACSQVTNRCQILYWGIFINSPSLSADW